MMRFSSEKELAKVVIAWLQDQHWDVYQEVQVFGGGSVADIVAVQNKLIWVIECKLSLGFVVLDQALAWTSYANYVSVATQYTRNRGELAHRICELFNIGHIEVHGDRAHGYELSIAVRERIRPGLRRRVIPDRILPCLTEAHKTFAEAGNANGRHWSPFKQTCRGVQQIVGSKPGISIKELIGLVNHHYSSSSTARSCLLKWIEAGKLEGVRMERNGRLIKLYPAEAVQ